MYESYHHRKIRPLAKNALTLIMVIIFTKIICNEKLLNKLSFG